MHYQFHQKVLFKHCDLAGIVFYPRYFEMINDAVEQLFYDLLDLPFENMHPASGVPTASIKVDFTAPSRHGDQLILNMNITAIGTTSMDLQTQAFSDTELRFSAEQSLVYVNAMGRPQLWPEAVRKKIETIMEATI